jgi:hypothetical protein
MEYTVLVGKLLQENIKFAAEESLYYYELKKYKPRFDEGCSKLFDPRKQSQIAAVTGSKRNKWG